MALSGSVFEIWHVTDRQTDRQTSAPFHDMATHSGPHNNITTTGCVYQTHTEHFYNISTVPKWLTHVFYVLLAKCGGSNPFENEFLGWKKTKARSETLQSDRTLQTINLHYRPWKRELAKWNSAVGQNSTNYQPSLPPMKARTRQVKLCSRTELYKLSTFTTAHESENSPSETLQSDRTLQTINLHYRPWKRELAKWNSAVGQNSTNYQPSLPPMPLIM